MHVHMCVAACQHIGAVHRLEEAQGGMNTPCSRCSAWVCLSPSHKCISTNLHTQTWVVCYDLITVQSLQVATRTSCLHTCTTNAPLPSLRAYASLRHVSCVYVQERAAAMDTDAADGEQQLAELTAAVGRQQEDFEARKRAKLTSEGGSKQGDAGEHVYIHTQPLVLWQHWCHVATLSAPSAA